MEKIIISQLTMVATAALIEKIEEELEIDDPDKEKIEKILRSNESA